ncbi:MAG: SIS domain-containing protein [Saccharofermentanales bacterium]
MTKMLEEIMEQPEVLAGIEIINKPTLTALVAELNERKTKHVVFAGRGTSDHASIYGQYLLGIYKGAVSALAIPSCITLYDGKLDFSDDLIIGVSQSGKAADALAVIERGNEQGAITLAITNDADSPMANIAKYHLFCYAGLEKSVAATKTFTAQMYLMALLTAYWSDNDEILRLLNELPSYCTQLLSDIEKSIEKKVDSFRYIKEGFILARGICYPIALEAALKIQETCYAKMKGYAISDFYHGPLAQIDSEQPVIILAPKGAAFDDTKIMIEKITSLGTHVMVVTDDSDLAGKYGQSVLIPDTGSEVTAAFLFAIFAQYFAQMLSVSKGLNPDEPRLLKKVTITK